MTNMWRLFLLIVALSFSAASSAYVDQVDENLLGFVENGVKIDSSALPPLEVFRCKRLFDRKLSHTKNIYRKVLSHSSSDRFVLLLKVNESWNSASATYVEYAQKKRASIFIYGDDEVFVKKTISASKAKQLFEMLKVDWSSFRYTYTRSIQDGDCALLVLKNGAETSAVILPPGGFIQSQSGDPMVGISNLIDEKTSKR